MAKLRITDLTKAFVQTVDNLLLKSKFKNQKELAKSIEWSAPSISACKKSKMNVPSPVAYRLFTLMVDRKFPDDTGYFKYFRNDSKPIAHQDHLLKNSLTIEARIQVLLSAVIELKSLVTNKSIAAVTAEIEKDIRDVEHILLNDNKSKYVPEKHTQFIDNQIVSIGKVRGDKHDMKVGFKPPTLHTSGKKWYIEYYYRIPEILRPKYGNKIWKRFKVYEDINKKKSMEYANTLRDAIEFALMGDPESNIKAWSPFERELENHEYADISDSFKEETKKKLKAI